jgi:hypothetical protein
VFICNDFIEWGKNDDAALSNTHHLLDTEDDRSSQEVRASPARQLFSIGSDVLARLLYIFDFFGSLLLLLGFAKWTYRLVDVIRLM